MQTQLLFITALVAVIFLTSTNLVAGQVHRAGKCPKVTPQKNFNIKEYMGKWHTIKKYPAFPVEGAHCGTAEHYETGKGTFSVIISQLDKNNQVHTIKGTGRVVGNAHFLERFESSPPGEEYNYWVIATDYKKYAVLYRCDDKANGHDEFLWLLTRDRVPTAEVVKAGESAMVAHGLSLKELEKVNQSNCN